MSKKEEENSKCKCFFDQIKLLLILSNKLWLMAHTMQGKPQESFLFSQHPFSLEIRSYSVFKQCHSLRLVK